MPTGSLCRDLMAVRNSSSSFAELVFFRGLWHLCVIFEALLGAGDRSDSQFICQLCAYVSHYFVSLWRCRKINPGAEPEAAFL